MKKAFTLIELLVVIAIIAILAAMLMPALARARALARTRACMTQVKNTGISYAFYIDDNNTYPDFNTSGKCLYALLDGDYVDGVEMFQCPNDAASGIQVDLTNKTITDASYAQDASPDMTSPRVEGEAGIPNGSKSARVYYGDSGYEIHGDLSVLLFIDSHSEEGDVREIEDPNDPAIILTVVSNPLFPDADTRVYVDELNNTALPVATRLERQTIDASID